MAYDRSAESQLRHLSPCRRKISNPRDNFRHLLKVGLHKKLTAKIRNSWQPSKQQEWIARAVVRISTNIINKWWLANSSRIWVIPKGKRLAMGMFGPMMPRPHHLLRNLSMGTGIWFRPSSLYTSRIRSDRICFKRACSDKTTRVNSKSRTQPSTTTNSATSAALSSISTTGWAIPWSGEMGRVSAMARSIIRYVTASQCSPPPPLSSQSQRLRHGRIWISNIWDSRSTCLRILTILLRRKWQLQACWRSYGSGIRDLDFRGWKLSSATTRGDAWKVKDWSAPRPWR